MNRAFKIEHTGVELIAKERQEQIEKHGYDVIDDVVFYEEKELQNAAAFCLTLNATYYPQTWGDDFMESIESKRNRLPHKDFNIERLKIAGALIAAEIDRIQSK
jgi:hypothetical protein